MVCQFLTTLGAGATTDSSSDVLLDLVVVLTTAACVTVGFRRFRLAPIPGYIIAGILIGPSVLSFVGDAQSINDVSHLAILLLMFGIGLHLDPSGIGRGAVQILGVGIAATVVIAIGGWPIAAAFGLSAPAALAVSMAMSIASAAVVLQILQQRRELATQHGRMCFGILIVQDLSVLVILAVLPALALWVGDGSAEQVARGTAQWSDVVGSRLLAAAGVAVVVFIGRRVLPRLLAEAAKGSSGELVLVLATVIALGAAAITSLLGFKAELGAFLAGFLLASTPFKHQIVGQLMPMRGLFMAVYFTAIGLRIVPAEVFAHAPAICIGLVILVVGKSVVMTIAAWAAGATGAASIVTGLSLAHASVFSLVILDAAVGHNVVNADAGQMAIAVVVLSLMSAPALISLGHLVSPMASRVPLLKTTRRGGLNAQFEAGEARVTDGHVIIVGFGPVGRVLAEHLESRDVPITVLEINPKTVEKQTNLGRSILYGDVTNPEVLEKAGIRTAAAVLLTTSHDEATLQACQVIRSVAPDVFIGARMSYLSKAMLAKEMGVDHVTVEEIAAAEAMEREVLAKLRELPGNGKASSDEAG